MTAAEMNAKYDLEERLLDFTCGVIDVVESLVRSRAGNHVGGQLIKSGTSPIANYAEAQSAESRADFVHKLKVVLKELRESRVWLMVIDRKKLSNTPARVREMLSECEELIRIFRKSIDTAERNKHAGRPEE
ncbi:MAG TPA: four helix bundle protein [Phycisphaerae bacterium]|nr:four helix bundle protein [Phycisphaerae bacterium]